MSSFFKFALVGLVLNVVFYALFAMMYLSLHPQVHYAILLVVTYVAGLLTSTWVYRRFVFPGTTFWKDLRNYFTSTVVYALVSAGVFGQIERVAGEQAVWLHIPVLVALGLFSFLVSKFWVFKSKPTRIST
jgi:putative flippase GtrA